MAKIVTKNMFAKWLLDLDGKVTILETDFACGNIQSMMKQVETYESEVKRLLGYADQHRIKILKHYDKFQKISNRLIVLKGKVEEQSQRSQRQDPIPLWDIARTIGTIVEVFQMLSGNLVGAQAIDKLMTLLPNSSGSKQLLIPQFAASLQEQRNGPITSPRAIGSKESFIKYLYYRFLKLLS